MSAKIEYIDTPTGAKLAVYTFPEPMEPKGIVHINHGMAEHMGRYARFADALARAGYLAIGHDHRGHGKTTTHENLPLGQFASENGWEFVITDVFAVNAFIRERYPDLPICYFGHSMGSILGLNYCIRHSDTIQAAALWNSGVDGGALLAVLRMMLKAERMFKGSDVPSTLANALTFKTWNKKFAPNRTEFDWLSTNEAEVDKYVADPLCGFMASNSLWLDITQGIAAGADDTQIAKIRKDLPMHLLGGALDPCTDNGKAMTRIAERLKKSGIKDLTCEIIAGIRHETLNEQGHENATADFVSWLDQKLT